MERRPTVTFRWLLFVQSNSPLVQHNRPTSPSPAVLLKVVKCEKKRHKSVDVNVTLFWKIYLLSLSLSLPVCLGDTSFRGQLKCDGTRAETTFRLSAKRTSPFKSAERRQFSRLLAAEVCASAVVMLDTPCSEIVWRVLATHSIRQFPLHFPFRASPCAITFQMKSTIIEPSDVTILRAVQ